VLKLEDSRNIGCNSRICHTCVRILEELCIELSVINFHREIEPANLLQYIIFRMWPWKILFKYHSLA
jgi:hypothetical protein